MERDQLIARWSKEDAAVQAITKTYAKLIEAESARGATGGLKEIGAAAGESRASLALLGEEIGSTSPATFAASSVPCLEWSRLWVWDSRQLRLPRLSW